MMKRAYVITSLFILAFSACLACGGVIRSTPLPVPVAIGLSDELQVQDSDGLRRSLASKIKPVVSRRIDGVDIVIFKYIPEKEVISYSGNDDIPIEGILIKGSVSAILKLKGKGFLKKTIFIDASGASRSELVDGLANEINNRLSHI